ncbi:radical SAM family heme chaperone HemW [Moraxella sp. ZY210820]|uniref:radical SAM family heme chaperone HemW n=1 Tax=unclassified Moraxella TaxID=2685852 RepID=UPI0027319601|nr:radical SAM family heme chaperone HemW [Moraxella sp. ZY210820]WLF84530.1 radical SAM family heme chaperone HemW [Moraxella sp. ZY210820]
MLNPQSIPQSLYIHVPWCIKKCPYCDFNSHAVPNGVLEFDLAQNYMQALWKDFQSQTDLLQQRPIHSIFIGGGTPSLISAEHYQRLFNKIQKITPFQDFYTQNPNIEITLEANPASIEHDPFLFYLEAGINRISLGVQSFNDEHLKQLGRIHSADSALNAIQHAKQAGFQRINVDLMHGLPNQTQEQALNDLKTAIDAGVTHISWYQLTIEPNTVFYRTQPILPPDDTLADIQQAGEQLLKQHGFVQYEISAWRKELPSSHNLNYWQFGDYLAIGAGAHGKITQNDGIYRYQKTRLPKDYLAKQPAENLQFQQILAQDLAFEFMMNALRLHYPVPLEYFSQRTGLDIAVIQPTLDKLRQKYLVIIDDNKIQCSTLGHQYLNDVLQYFLSE